MKLALVALSLVLAVSGCTRADWTGRKVEASPPSTPPPPRYFDEKVRCATVGERWENRICGEGSTANPLCVGSWAYNAEHDTCVGVFLSAKEGRRFLYVIDLLTAVSLEPDCYADCNAESAKQRWILPPPPAAGSGGAWKPPPGYVWNDKLQGWMPEAK